MLVLRVCHEIRNSISWNTYFLQFPLLIKKVLFCKCFDLYGASQLVQYLSCCSLKRHFCFIFTAIIAYIPFRRTKKKMSSAHWVQQNTNNNKIIINFSYLLFYSFRLNLPKAGKRKRHLKVPLDEDKFQLLPRRLRELAKIRNIVWAIHVQQRLFRW